MDIIGTVINGLSLGSVYALIALGYTMVYGIAKMLNFAHGDIIMVGSYGIFVIVQMFATQGEQTPVWVSFLGIFVALLVCVLLGVLIERVAYRPLRGAASLSVLITAIGVSFLLQSVAQMIFTADPQVISMFDLKAIQIGTLVIKIETIITLVVGVLIMIALTVFVNKTKTGRAMLAVSEDRGAAQLMGIHVNRTIAITFAIGSALAAVASVFYLFVSPQTSPTFGAMPGIKAFVAAVLGGIGSIPGAMLGGVLLGLVEQVALRYETVSPYADAIVYGILFVVLLVRPSGLLGKKRHEKV